MIDTYQPLSTFDRESFKSMINSCSSRSGKYIINSSRMVEMLKNQAAAARVVLKSLFNNNVAEDIAITIDKWSSNAHDSYIGIYIHCIDSEWVLHDLCSARFVLEQ